MKRGLHVSFSPSQPYPPPWHPKPSYMEQALRQDAGDQHEQAEGDQRIIPPVVSQLVQPGARTRAEAAQVHGVNDVFRADDSMDGHRHDKRAELTNLLEDAAGDLFEFIAARPLCSATTG